MTRPLRIVHIYNWLNPANGGPPRGIAGLAAAQQARGHHVSFVSHDPPDTPALDALFAEYFPAPPPRLALRLPLPHRLNRALEGVDVAHLHGIWPPMHLVASRICRARGIPYVLAPRGSLHHGALGEKRVKKLLGMHILGYGRLIKGAAALHMLNREEAEGAPQALLPARVEVIPNGIFVERFSTPPPPGSFRATVPGLGDAPYVLFLSRMHPGKGCDLLATAFGALARVRPDVHLVAAGGDHGGRALFEAGARAHGYVEKLHLVGELNGARKDGAFQDAALFVLPSHHEGFSMAITEALAWGRPVVLSRQCHYPMVAEVDAGRVVELDAEAITRGMLELLADPVAAEAMGQRGRALVFSRYRWESIAAQMEALYRDLIG